MNKITKVSLEEAISGLEFLPDRTPRMAFSGGAERAFAKVAEYGEGAIYVGHYSGSSEWERHSKGDEVVMALAGSTTVILLLDGKEERVPLATNQLMVVPSNTWHRFEGSNHLEIMTVTPQPTDHSLELPDE